MAPRGDRCRICNTPMTAEGQCPECDNVLNLEEKKELGLLPKKDDKQTKENAPVEAKILPLRKSKKTLRSAFLFNQTNGERHSVSNPITRIGRDRTNNLALSDDPYVSRHHAWILQNQGGFWLEDLGSTNTTLLNGEPVTERTQIIAGDKLTFGKTDLIFFAEK
jgi:hypothetical protein